MNKILAIILFTSVCFGWSRYDWENHSYVDIEKGNKVRSGSEIEIFDYKDSRYKNVEVLGINRGIGSSTEIEIYDHSDNSYRILEMSR